MVTEALPVLAIVGPTAVGKTALSLALAERLPIEIISADSRLFYRGMDIGTAKPSLAERGTVPHHMIDICTPDESVSVGQYKDTVDQLIADIHGRQHIPVLVGGTGQYIFAVLEGWGIPRVAPQPALRAALEALGGPELARWLRHLDPITADVHDPRNVRRVVRALEVTLVAGRPISELQTKTPPDYPVHIIGLTVNREKLYARIDQRVDDMVAQGLVDEVRGLLAAGYSAELSSMSGLGYRQMAQFINGHCTLAEATEKTKTDTHRFVRQQGTWFRQDDPRITWHVIDEAAYPANALAHCAALIPPNNK